MNLDKLRSFLAVPFACLFVILMLCVFAVQSPVPSGIRIPMMQMRVEPLSNCEFNGFTVYLRSDGQIGGGDPDSRVSQSEILSRIAEARDNIQDDTIFVITEPSVPYERFVDLLAKIHNVAPADHIAVVTKNGQVEGVPLDSGLREKLADRCRFEWPAVIGQPKWPVDDSRIALGRSMKRMSAPEALTSPTR
jgi:biopolymer transport protein ExbD